MTKVPDLSDILIEIRTPGNIKEIAETPRRMADMDLRRMSANSTSTSVYITGEIGDLLLRIPNASQQLRFSYWWHGNPCLHGTGSSRKFRSTALPVRYPCWIADLPTFVRIIEKVASANEQRLVRIK